MLAPVLGNRAALLPGKRLLVVKLIDTLIEVLAGMRTAALRGSEKA